MQSAQRSEQLAASLGRISACLLPPVLLPTSVAQYSALVTQYYELYPLNLSWWCIIPLGGNDPLGERFALGYGLHLSLPKFSSENYAHIELCEPFRGAIGHATLTDLDDVVFHPEDLIGAKLLTQVFNGKLAGQDLVAQSVEAVTYAFGLLPARLFQSLGGGSGHFH